METIPMKNTPGPQDKRTTHTSKQLSWLLRHGARETGLAMDAAGWAHVEDVLRVLSLDRAELVRAVEHNTKARLQWEGERIRACQGHSTDGTPVTAEALEASWQRCSGPGPWWHGTSLDVLEDIARLGLLPMARTHVHLAEEVDSHVGKRAEVDVLLKVDGAALETAGIGVFRSPNGVLLARRVPPEALTGARLVTRRARAARVTVERVFRVLD